jgi:hypothetical protein
MKSSKIRGNEDDRSYSTGASPLNETASLSAAAVPDPKGSALQ